MTTKEQERKALAKIRAIVDELGSDSYVATAFEGCFEMAEQNIDDDSALSYKGRCELLEEELEKSEAEIRQYEKDTGEILAEAKKFREAYDSEVRNKEIAVENCNILNEQLLDLKIENENLKTEVLFHKSTIVQLKAKLFDLLYKEES